MQSSISSFGMNALFVPHKMLGMMSLSLVCMTLSMMRQVASVSDTGLCDLLSRRSPLPLYRSDMIASRMHAINFCLLLNMCCARRAICADILLRQSVCATRSTVMPFAPGMVPFLMSSIAFDTVSGVKSADGVSCAAWSAVR